MFCEFPKPYLQPSQSKYHNLGMNIAVYPRSTYPGKLGISGDYGPNQEGCYPKRTEYTPLDQDPIENKRTVCLLE